MIPNLIHINSPFVPFLGTPPSSYYNIYFLSCNYMHAQLHTYINNLAQNQGFNLVKIS